MTDSAATTELPQLELLESCDALPTAAKARTAPNHHRPVYIETYGCQMNVADTEVVASILSDAGYRIVDSPEEAKIILINTCAVRENAEERVIGRVGQLHGLRRTQPDLTIGVLGCMAQHLTDTLPQRAPFVDLVAGPDAYQRLPELLAQTADETLLDTRLSRTENYVGIDPARKDGTNAWVTIIRGCDKFCTFCVVPYVRGRERSVPSDEILRQVRDLARAGFREVTLLGQTVNSYDDGQRDFARLLDEVAEIDGVDRIRFTSPYPADFNEATIDAIARLPQVCPSLHLPVQSASEEQLEIMRRGYTIAEYRDLVVRLREAIPDLALTTDIIVGFSGESDDDFQKTVDLMEEIRFDSAFMFRYSERSGTFAHKNMPDDVPDDVKAARLHQIIELQEGISAQMNQQWIGRTVEVLVEGKSRRPGPDGQPTFFGRSPQGKVTIIREPAQMNDLVQVRIDRVTSHTLYGTSEL
ncbi:MAG: tRNA (N6-isopentenyl adenosine(37)-C2)-methylthiotransferase MiaB [Gemmatimonadetes bacterium]|jgi:tRNA-2-methylthio-N6-dimethylallyladenosine synthase|nr:tRNA (N6-isopentenyl adenosine(37)-C2)-methylthiotransferase MiaB [Gemmatimonadota bacterium]MBT5143672.1 tRNA (N6-isopentenyl adenosine(37)-C2)-methylthiotransferase MiaB [Gemmatimonadota bacterium]MBT5588532.1 tRNA (N6-isopentenyl adenosine(37)-C2)-methylthiotransferase MiaB [Gemmatimonadota bacterium]MBT7597946.1 tRNA (N6-isopentenyl adenosine(37)-C2)-methylthiotransferase MiaB [Gemmatimonadota bacterium]